LTDNDKDFKTNDKRFESSDNAEKTTEQQNDYPPIKINFETFVVSLHTATVICLGLVPNPTTNKTETNLPLAQQNIDMLEMLEEKTKGNLKDGEKNVLTNALYDVRMKYLEISKKKS